MKLRVLTFNILDNGHGREELIKQTIQDSAADIIFLQEVYQPETAEALARAVEMHSYFAPGRAKRCSAILSRYPLENSRAYTDFPMYTGLLETAVTLSNGRQLNLFGVHLFPFPPCLAEYWRVWQTKHLIQRAAPYKDSLSLLAGDFNTMVADDYVATEEWPIPLKIMTFAQGNNIFRRALDQILQAGYIDSYRQLNPDKHGHTMPAWAPNSRLDYIFASPSMSQHLHKAEVFVHSPAIPNASDHLPVLVTFDIPD